MSEATVSSIAVGVLLGVGALVGLVIAAAARDRGDARLGPIYRTVRR
jgi:hypothetical protein